MTLEWIEAHCVVPDGFRKGQPFRLYDYQGQYLREFYRVRGSAVWVPENPILAPAFVYRRGLLVGPQKVGKNPLVAAQVTAEFVGPVLFAGWAGKGDGYACSDHGCRCGWEYAYEPDEPRGMPWPTPKIQITAFSEDSTENTYDALRPMISQGPLADLLPKAGEEFIRHPSGAEDARIDTVTSSNQSRLGARSTFVPQDELGLWTAQNKMVKLADTQYRNLAGMGGRASLTTNAWNPSEHSVAQREYESKAQDVYRQYVVPPANLSYGDKRERHKIHQSVYPPDTLRENGGHVDLDAIEAEAADLHDKDAPQAERFFGNRSVAGAGIALDPTIWDAAARPGDPPPQGSYIGAGFDGSVSEDATFLRGETPDGRSFLIGKWIRPTGDEMLRWRNEHPGEDWRVPRTEVKARVAWMRGHYRVARFRYDPAKWWTEGAEWEEEFGLASDGKPVVVALDTIQVRRFAPACDRWLTDTKQGRHTHDADPDTDDHVKAAHLKPVKLADQEDGRTLYVVIKGDDRRKIDGCVADILAHEAAMSMPPAPPPFRSNYEDEGLTFAGSARTT